MELENLYSEVKSLKKQKEVMLLTQYNLQQQTNTLMAQVELLANPNQPFFDKQDEQLNTIHNGITVRAEELVSVRKKLIDINNEIIDLGSKILTLKKEKNAVLA